MERVAKTCMFGFLAALMLSVLGLIGKIMLYSSLGLGFGSFLFKSIISSLAIIFFIFFLAIFTHNFSKVVGK